MLVKTITAFTVAHSITLAIGDARLRISAAAAAERSHRAQYPVSRTGDRAPGSRRDEPHDSPPVGRRLRLRAVCTVSASRAGLRAMGLPQAEIPLALLLFNVGVEIGQLAFVALIVLLERSFRTLEIVWPRPVETAAGLRDRLARRVLDDSAHVVDDARRRRRDRDAVRACASLRGARAIAAATAFASALVATTAHAHVESAGADGLACRPLAPGLGSRPRARDGGGRPLGRAARVRRRCGCCRSCFRW